MNHQASLYAAGGIIALTVTVALILGHTTQVVWVGVCGSLVAQGVLANILRAFK